jgi:hypothetical protein
MGTTARVTAALCSILALAAAQAEAATTYSPPVRSSDGDVLGCVVQNLRDDDVAVTAELNSGFDSVIESATLDIPSGQARTVVFTTTQVFGAYCVFAFAGDADSVRGFVQLIDIGGSNTRLLYPASEARGVSTDEQETFSPPVRSSQGDVLSCIAQNLSDEAVQIEAEIRNSQGAVVTSDMINVAAGRVQTVAFTTSSVFGAYCRFRFEASPERGRGYVQLMDIGGSNTRLLYPAADKSLGRTIDDARTVSPPVRSSDGDVLACWVQNLGDEAVEVDVEIDNGLGTIVDSGTQSIPAGWVQSVASTTSAVFGAYCSFAFDGNPSTLRGFAQLYDLGGSNTRLLYPAARPHLLVDTFSGAIELPLLAGTDAALSGSTTLARPLQSPPMRSSDGDVLSCIVQNLSDESVDVEAHIDNGLDTIITSGDVTVLPGRALTVASTTTQVFGAFCQFEIGSRANIRGFAQLMDIGGSNTRLLYGASAPLVVVPVPTPSPSHTATVDPTVSVTPASPTPSATTDPTTAATPTECLGDCDGNGSVSISELVTMVNIALGNRPLADCLAGDRDGGGSITIAELIAAVNNALNGCP